jgi:hypothetical protein
MSYVTHDRNVYTVSQISRCWCSKEFLWFLSAVQQLYQMFRPIINQLSILTGILHIPYEISSSVPRRWLERGGKGKGKTMVDSHGASRDLFFPSPFFSQVFTRLPTRISTIPTSHASPSTSNRVSRQRAFTQDLDSVHRVSFIVACLLWCVFSTILAGPPSILFWMYHLPKAV